MLHFFIALPMLAFVLAVVTALPQPKGGQPSTEEIGTCFPYFNCTGSQTKIFGTRHGNNHVGCNSFENKFTVFTVCKAGDCSADCDKIPEGFKPGCLVSNNAKDPIGCVKL